MSVAFSSEGRGSSWTEDRPISGFEMALKCFGASSPDLARTGTFRRRPMTSATGTPSFATAWYRALAKPFSAASVKRWAASSRWRASG
jgi:hypothetical protein